MKEIFTTGDIGKILGCAPGTVAIWFDSEELKGYRVSNPKTGDRRIPREELIKFFKKYNLPKS